MYGYDLSNNNSAWANQNNLVPMISAFGTQNPPAAALQTITPPTSVVTPPVTGGTTGPTSAGLGFNMETGKLLLGGIQSIGSIWNAWEAQKLAKKQFAFQKDITETNLRNQIQSYNTTLEDRSRSRAQTEGQSAATAQSYVDKNRLSR